MVRLCTIDPMGMIRTSLGASLSPKVMNVVISSYFQPYYSHSVVTLRKKTGHCLISLASRCPKICPPMKGKTREGKSVLCFCKPNEAHRALAE